MNMGNSSGKVLLRVIICSITLLIVGGFIALLLRSFEHKKLENDRKALAISEYGLMMALQKINREPSWRSGIDKEPYEGGAYEVSLEQKVRSDTLRVRLTATGEMGSVTKTKECILRLDISDGDSSWVRESMF